MEPGGERPDGAKAADGEAVQACGNVCATCPRRLTCPAAAMPVQGRK